MGDIWRDGESDEKPTFKVTFTYDFWLGTYEVTYDEYDVFCDDTLRSNIYDFRNWGRGQRPVIYVSWWDAIAYCNWLSEKEMLPKAYNDRGELLDEDGKVTSDLSKVVGYRLPTEAEWEYAARGGKNYSPNKYSGSDNVDDVAWYNSNSGDKTQEVGLKLPNALGLYDMSGNVGEWCYDWYNEEYYSNCYSKRNSVINPFCNYPQTYKFYRVCRGGSWYYNDNATDARVANRGYMSPDSIQDYLGFRIARTVP